MKQHRLDTIVGGLRKYWYWLENYKKQTPSEYYNDGYDNTTEQVIKLLNILNWINGDNHLYDEHNFTDRDDIADLIYPDETNWEVIDYD